MHEAPLGLKLNVELRLSGNSELRHIGINSSLWLMFDMKATRKCPSHELLVPLPQHHILSVIYDSSTTNSPKIYRHLLPSLDSRCFRVVEIAALIKSLLRAFRKLPAAKGSQVNGSN